MSGETKQAPTQGASASGSTARMIVNAANCHEELLHGCKCALADLEGIMPEYEASGDRLHPGWATIKELRAAIAKAEGGAS